MAMENSFMPKKMSYILENGKMTSQMGMECSSFQMEINMKGTLNRDSNMGMELLPGRMEWSIRDSLE